MKLRITIVVLGLLLGLVARMAVLFYQSSPARSASPAPPAAATSPLSLKTESGR